MPLQVLQVLALHLGQGHVDARELELVNVDQRGGDVALEHVAQRHVGLQLVVEDDGEAVAAAAAGELERA